MSKVPKGGKQKRITVKGISTVALFTAFVAVCSFVSLPLGAVPVTFQSVGIIVAAGLLGTKKGLFVTLGYLALGVVGLPVFSSFTGGYGVLLSPTGGFLIGFIPMSFIVGLLTSKWGRDFKGVALSGVIGTLVLYLFGVIFYANLHLDGCLSSYLAAIWICVIPFLVPDLFKIVLSALLVSRLKRFI